MQKLHGYGFNDNMEDPPPFFVRRWAPTVNQETPGLLYCRSADAWCLWLWCCSFNKFFMFIALCCPFLVARVVEFTHWILWKSVTKPIYTIKYGTYIFFHPSWRFPKIYLFLLNRKADKSVFLWMFFPWLKVFVCTLHLCWVLNLLGKHGVFLFTDTIACAQRINFCNYSFKLIIFI
jgi:hypothetical protein